MLLAFFACACACQPLVDLFVYYYNFCLLHLPLVSSRPLLCASDRQEVRYSTSPGHQQTMHGFAHGARSFVRLSLYSFVVFLLVSSSGLFFAIKASALTHLPPEKKTPLLHLAEKQLLKMMDLSVRPTGRSRAESKSISVPAVMMHLQRAQETANQDASWFGQSPELADRALILTGSANTVRSQLQVESGHSSPFPDLKLLVFNVSIPANEMLLEAKFFLSDSYAVSSTSLHTNQNYVHHHHHLRRRPHPSFSFSSSSPTSSSSTITKTQSTQSSSFKVPTQSTDDSSSTLRRVTLFDVLSPPPAFTSEWSLNDLIARSIDTAVIDLSQPVTWPHFDVTPALQRWLSHPGSFHGLAIHMTHVNGSKVNQSELVLESSSSPSPSSSSSSSSSSSPSPSPSFSSSSLAFAMGRVDPVLLTYTSRRSEKKQPHAEALKNRVRRRAESASGRKTHRRKGKRDACRRHSMYIDFTDVGWNDWIVAPLGYHAYVCLGECPYPLGDHLNTTNHAIVQTLVNSINPSAVPKACCVPTELSPISMLYVDEDDRIVLKNYQDMVVEGCGCR